MKGVIYKITNRTNGKVYIGETINFKERMQKHHSDSLKKDNKFYRAIRKYQWKNFESIILEEIENDDKLMLSKILDEREIFYIKQYDSIKKGYNITLGNPNKKGGCIGEYNAQYIQKNIDEKLYIEKAKEGLTRKELADFFKLPEQRLKAWRAEKKQENPTHYNKLFQELDKCRRLKSSQRKKILSKISPEILEKIDALYDNGLSMKEISKELKISYSSIRYLRRDLEKIKGKKKRTKNPNMGENNPVYLNLGWFDENLYFQEREQGFSDAEFCKIHNIPKNHLNIWKRRKEKEEEKYKKTFNELKVKTRARNMMLINSYPPKLLNQIKKLRESGVSQEKTAQILGLKRDNIRHVEAGFKRYGS